MNAYRDIKQVPSLPARPSDAHKGMFGTVIVVGGAIEMIGAPAISAAAALRSGAGLVKIASSRQVVPHAIGIEPSATGILLDDQSPATSLDAIDRADPEQRAVLAIGPGLGTNASAAELVARLLDGQRAIVLDADGLNLLAKRGTPQPRSPEAPPLVLTPHPGEFRRLAQAAGIEADPVDESQRPRAAARLAEAHGAVVVLKGRGTVVCDPAEPRRYVNDTGGPAMATAGSGDVLTGLVAALMAQGLDGFSAAVLGVYLHGLAGDLWAEANGSTGLTAMDLARALPRAFQQLRARQA